MLPGRSYTPEEIIGTLRRRWLAVAVPAVLVALGTPIVTSLLPDVYSARAVILVVPQRVPENYVRSTVTTRLEDRLQTISQQILSRTRLEKIIADFDLYAEERKTALTEDILERMRRDIDIRIDNGRGRRDDGASFSVSYDAPTALLAMKVTERLGSLFIEENLRDREILAEGTNQFLESQLEEARRRLVTHEEKLEEYRRRYAGELPTQQQGNLQAIQHAQVQLQNLAEAAARDRDRRLVIQREIADVASQTIVQASARRGRDGEGDESDGGPIATPAEQLEAARRTMTSLQARLTAEHPDVVRQARRVRELEAAVEREAARAPLGDGTPARALTPAEAVQRNRAAELRAEADSLQRELERKAAEELRLRRLIELHQRRVDASPTREAELVALTRDYDTLQNLYTSLLSKNEEAKISANLERRQIGEQFRLLDAARLPERPASPNRPLLNVLGALVGIGLGLGIGILLEYRDNSIRNEDDVLRVLGLPVVAVVPTMWTAREKRRLRRRRLALLSGTAVVMLVAGSALVWRLLQQP
ncbi:MAG: hypothetical protein HYU53_10155 [Acidobacteria bacterium]|nr:hypothetical protein [Acidobacteriota bacterium]